MEKTRIKIRVYLPNGLGTEEISMHPDCDILDVIFMLYGAYLEFDIL